MKMRFAAPSPARRPPSCCSAGAATTARPPSRRAKTWNSSECGGVAGQTLNISAEEEDGEVTGEFRVTENVITLECADTDTDGVVILGGEVTAIPRRRRRRPARPDHQGR